MRQYYSNPRHPNYDEYELALIEKEYSQMINNNNNQRIIVNTNIERDKTTFILLMVIIIQLLSESVFRLMNLVSFACGMRIIYIFGILMLKKNGGNDPDNYRHLYIYYIGLFDTIQNLAWLIIYKNSLLYNIFSLLISIAILIILYGHILFINDNLQKNKLFIYFYSTKIGYFIINYIGIINNNDKEIDSESDYEKEQLI